MSLDGLRFNFDTDCYAKWQVIAIVWFDNFAVLMNIDFFAAGFVIVTASQSDHRVAAATFVHLHRLQAAIYFVGWRVFDLVMAACPIHQEFLARSRCVCSLVQLGPGILLF